MTLEFPMVAKRDVASKVDTKKLMDVLKKKTTQLKKKSKEEAALKKALLAVEEAQRELYQGKTTLTHRGAVKKKVTKKQTKQEHHNVS